MNLWYIDCEGGRVDRGVWRADICNSERSRSWSPTFQAKRSSSAVQIIHSREAPSKVLMITENQKEKEQKKKEERNIKTGKGKNFLAILIPESSELLLLF